MSNLFVGTTVQSEEGDLEGIYFQLQVLERSIESRLWFVGPTSGLHGPHLPTLLDEKEGKEDRSVCSPSITERVRNSSPWRREVDTTSKREREIPSGGGGSNKDSKREGKLPACFRDTSRIVEEERERWSEIQVVLTMGETEERWRREEVKEERARERFVARATSPAASRSEAMASEAPWSTRTTPSWTAREVGPGGQEVRQV